MKNFLFALLIAFCGSLSAQATRFVYEYRYIPDTLAKDKVQTDLMALDISAKGSTYQSLTKIRADSAMRANIEKMVRSGGGLGSASVLKSTATPGTVRYRVEKEYPSFATYLIDRLGMDNYRILEDEKQTWKILPDTRAISGYQVQKATTAWGGRQWTAWFAKDLPFADGPYKFSGLPGLILEVEDATGSHRMTLAGVSKIQTASAEGAISAGSGVTVDFKGKEISVSEPQFRKAWQNYIADPGKDLRAMASPAGAGSTSASVSFSDASGKPMSASEMARKAEENIKNRLLHDNNRIEPTLYTGK